MSTKKTPIIKQNIIDSYKAGMIQGFRMLQSYLSFKQQKDFGFIENDGEINKKLKYYSEKYYDDCLNINKIKD